MALTGDKGGPTVTLRVNPRGAISGPPDSDPVMRQRLAGMAGGGGLDILSSIPGRLFLLVIGLQTALGLALLLGLLAGSDHWLLQPGAIQLLALAAVILIPAGAVATWLLVREQRLASRRAFRTAELMDTVLATSREWLWTVDADWKFTFSSATSTTLLGYDPAELIGRHCGLVADSDDLAAAQEFMTDPARDGSFSGMLLRCRHRDGSGVWLEVSGRARYDGNGSMTGLEGTSRPLGAEAAHFLSAQRIRARIEAVLTDLSFSIAFQPIYDLSTRPVAGAEALARFPVATPDVWFSEAASVGLGAELELAAVEAALAAAAGLPDDIYISVNLSPESCLDPRLSRLACQSLPAPRRIVLELTERTAVPDYQALQEALAPLRRSGIRLAVDDAGAGFASMRHILQLAPDFIKLDREIIAGIDTDNGQRALGAAMTEFAVRIGSRVVAEGIETEGELTVVTSLGIPEGQGYFLGRPSDRPEDWAQWKFLENTAGNQSERSI